MPVPDQKCETCREPIVSDRKRRYCGKDCYPSLQGKSDRAAPPPVAKAPRAPKKAPASPAPPPADATALLAQLVEDHQLVETIGRDACRLLAARMGGASS